MKKIGVLWKKKKDDRVYLTGILDLVTTKLNIVVLPNEKKQGVKSPDYNICMMEDNKNKTKITEEGDL